MSLKYYRDEYNKYGELGPVNEKLMLQALEQAYAHFNVPRVQLLITKTPRKSSWYTAGLNMFFFNLRRSKQPMKVPRIKMACNMLTWRVFCHELAHHIHLVRFNLEIQAKAGTTVKPTSTLEIDRAEANYWVRNNIKKQRAHGSIHAGVMKEVVDFFLARGMITETPTYLLPA